MAEWTTAYINDLPDGAFLYIEPGGEKDDEGKTKPRSLRHFPFKDSGGAVDLPHLRNALARIPQSNLPANVKTAATAKARALLEKANAAFAVIFDSKESTPQGEPTQDGDIAVQRFEKDLISLGTFKHPKLGWTLKVTRDRAKTWLAAFERMLAAGVEIPVNRDHQSGTAAHVGYLVGLAFRKSRLFGIVEARGVKAIEDCKRVNRVSIEVLPDFIDGKGVHYGEAIVGLAITSKPIATHQQGFVPIAASLDGQGTAGPEFEFSEGGETTVDFKALGEALGTEVTEDNCVAAVQAALKDRDDKLAASKEEATQLTAKVEKIEADHNAGTLELDADVADTLAEAIEARIEGLVAINAVTPDVAKKLSAVLAGAVGARPAVLLSRKALGDGAEQSLARKIVDVLKENKPVATGERTGVQTLTRDVPTADDKDHPGFNLSVQKQMIEMANAGQPAE